MSRQARAKGTEVGPLQVGIDVYLDEVEGLNRDVAMNVGADGRVFDYVSSVPGGVESVQALDEHLQAAAAELAAATRTIKDIKAKAWLHHGAAEE